MECVRRGLRGGRRASFASDEGHVLTGTGPFFIFKSKQAVCGGLGVMGKEETVMLIRLLHTSPLTIKQNKSGNMEKKKDRQLWRNGLHCCHYPWFEMHDVIIVVTTEVLERLKCFRRIEYNKKQYISVCFSSFSLLALNLRLFTSSILRKSPYGKFLMIGRWLITQHFSWRTYSSLMCDGWWCNKRSVIRKGGTVINPKRVMSILICLNHK